MKGKLLLILSVAVIATIGIILMEKAGDRGSQRSEIAAMLPADTEMLLKFKSAETMYETLLVRDDSIFGKKIPAKSLADLFGLNPLNLDELRANGIDTSGEFGIAVSSVQWNMNGDQPDITVVFIVPASDEAKASGAFEKALASKPEFKMENGVATFTLDSDLKGCMFSGNGHVVLAATSESDSPQSFVEKFKSRGKSLADSKMWLDVTDGIKASQEVFLYLNVKKLMKDLKNALQAATDPRTAEHAPISPKFLEYLDGYEGLGVACDPQGPDLSLSFAMTFAEGSVFSRIYSGAPNKEPLLGVKAHPMILMAGALNFPEYYDLFLNSMHGPERNDFEKTIRDLEAGMGGMEIKKDILENLAGNLNIAVYDGAALSLNNLDLLITVDVKEKEGMQKVLETIINNLSPDYRRMISREGDDYVMNMEGMFRIFAGFKGDTFAISPSRTIYDSLFKGDADRGFLAKINDEKLSDPLKERETSVFYLDFDELGKALNNFKMFISAFADEPKIAETESRLKQFKYLLSHSKMAKGSSTGSLILTTRFDKPFFAAIKDMLEKDDNGNSEK